MSNPESLPENPATPGRFLVQSRQGGKGEWNAIRKIPFRDRDKALRHARHEACFSLLTDAETRVLDLETSEAVIGGESFKSTDAECEDML